MTELNRNIEGCINSSCKINKFCRVESRVESNLPEENKTKERALLAESRDNMCPNTEGIIWEKKTN